jgi:hypothetical protein
MVTDDRRQFQRLRLAKPILAVMREHNALILDIGMTGAFVEHYGELAPGDTFNISFRWQGSDIEFVCEVARTTVVRTPGGDGQSIVSHTGVRFLEPLGDATGQLQDLMATAVGRILAAQRANAAGDLSDSRGATILDQIGEARRTRTTGFVSYRLRDGKWWRIPTQSSKQPPDGFTVAAYEDEEEVETLCRTYEKASDEARTLIRLVAELSVFTVRR